MVTYVRNLLLNGSRVFVLRHLLEWQWCCGFDWYLSCCLYLITEYGVADKSQKSKKWQPADLQLSLPIFPSYEGGNWVLVLLSGVSGKVCCYNLFYITLGYQFPHFPEINDHQKGHSIFKVFYWNVVQLCFNRSLIAFWMCSPAFK